MNPAIPPPPPELPPRTAHGTAPPPVIATSLFTPAPPAGTPPPVPKPQQPAAGTKAKGSVLAAVLHFLMGACYPYLVLIVAFMAGALTRVGVLGFLVGGGLLIGGMVVARAHWGWKLFIPGAILGVLSIPLMGFLILWIACSGGGHW